MCGVVGITGRSQAATWASRGLYALQHRGHDSCGIASFENENIQVLSGKGAVADVLPDDLTADIDSHATIGQNLYTTSGASHSPQPFGGRFWEKSGKMHQVALVHNGQLCGLGRLRKKYPVMYRSESDSEIIFALLPHMEGDTLVEKIKNLLSQLEGAFSLLFITENKLIAARDSHGFRPLIMGDDAEGAVMFASEINAFDLMEGRFIRQVEPGEMVIVRHDGQKDSIRYKEKEKKLNQCVFEHIYFARPDNQLFGKPGYSTQQELGRQVARELKGHVEADIVIPVPDSSNIATLGFAQEFGVPFEMGILRHHFASRTFITRGQSNREKAVRLKFNVIKDVIKGKRLILGDDSLVRSTTSKILIAMLRKGGAKEIHLVLFSPQIAHSCIYGINTPNEKELIAHSCGGDTSLIAKTIGADSVSYLSIEGLRQVMGNNPDDYCYACMDGAYPVPVEGLLS